MAKRTINVGKWRYEDADGEFHIAYFGNQVDFTPAELKRAEAAGVFKPIAPDPTVATELEAALAGIEPRVAQPAGAAESDAAPLHHDILSTPVDIPADIRVDGQDLPEDAEPIAPTLITEPVGPDPAATITVTDPAADKKPANAANVETWREYIAKVRPELADKVDGMTKDELKAAVPKGD